MKISKIFLKEKFIKVRIHFTFIFLKPIFEKISKKKYQYFQLFYVFVIYTIILRT